MIRKALFAAILLALPTIGSAQTLSTLFGSNNRGAIGGAVYFDVTVGSNALMVQSFTTNTLLGNNQSFGWNVYTLVGTRSGNEFNAGLWTLVATGTGIGTGIDNASAVTLNNTFLLSANTTYGMALVMGPEAQHAYTNGISQYSNADMTLDLGAATNVPFTSPLFSPRTWNGSITYSTNVVPEPATVVLLATGLAGLVVVRRRNKQNA